MAAANGSRECAPDDKLRDTHQLHLMAMMGFAGSTHSTSCFAASVYAKTGLSDLPVGRLFRGLSSLISDFPKNISVPTPPKSILELLASHPTNRGVSRSSRTRGGMRWTRQRFARDGIAWRVERLVSGQQRADERCCGVRRSRVVLTPRRWRQVRGCYVGPTGLRHNIGPWATVTNKRGHRGELEGNR
jgi:hypothetical protein